MKWLTAIKTERLIVDGQLRLFEGKKQYGEISSIKNGGKVQTAISS